MFLNNYQNVKKIKMLVDYTLLKLISNLLKSSLSHFRGFLKAQTQSCNHINHFCTAILAQTKQWSWILIYNVTGLKMHMSLLCSGYGKLVKNKSLVLSSALKLIIN